MPRLDSRGGVDGDDERRVAAATGGVGDPDLHIGEGAGRLRVGFVGDTQG
jgi:hypothetical protein